LDEATGVTTSIEPDTVAGNGTGGSNTPQASVPAEQGPDNGQMKPRSTPAAGAKFERKIKGKTIEKFDIPEIQRNDVGEIRNETAVIEPLVDIRLRKPVVCLTHGRLTQEIDDGRGVHVDLYS